MATDRTFSYTRIVIGGKIGSAQTWSIGVSVQNTGAIGPATPSTMAAVKTAVSDWWTAWTNQGTCGVSTDVTLESVSAYHYASGSSTADSIEEETFTGLHGPSGTVLSPRDALVVTLKTGHPGASYRGRVYLPVCGATLSNHQYQANTVDVAASAFATLLHDLNSATAPDKMIVAGKAGAQVITSVSADSLVDTQRRREDKFGATANSSYAVAAAS